MPIHIVRDDITNMKVDAIVNAANNSLGDGAGVNGAIHRAAGPGLARECRELRGCRTGDAKITRGYNLPCRYVIHTVGPVWQGGTENEEALLKSAYRSSLTIARDRKLKSVAFPLISAGVFGYPKDQALRIARETIQDFLEHNDYPLDVYIVVFDPQAFQIADGLYPHSREDSHLSDGDVSVTSEAQVGDESARRRRT